MRRRFAALAVLAALLLIGAVVGFWDSLGGSSLTVRLSGGPSANAQFDDTPFEITARDEYQGKLYDWRLKFPRAYYSAGFGGGKNGLSHYISLEVSAGEPYVYVLRREQHLPEHEQLASPVLLTLGTMRPHFPARSEANFKDLLEGGCVTEKSSVEGLVNLRAKDGSVDRMRCGFGKVKTYLIAEPILRTDLAFRCAEDSHTNRPSYIACDVGYVSKGWYVWVKFAATELPRWRRVLLRATEFLNKYTVSTTSNMPSTEVRSLIEGVR